MTADDPAQSPDSEARSFVHRALGGIDRWAANPTRAWATWLVLYVLSAFTFSWVAPEIHRTVNAVLWWIEDAAGFPAVTMAPLWMDSLFIFSMTWFVPILLRLNLVRALLWLLPICLARSIIVFSGSSITTMGYLFVELAIGMAHVFILRGKRQPAYAAVVAAAISGGFWQMWTLASGLPLEFTSSTALLDQAIYAAILLYGTKLIDPKVSQSAEQDLWNQGGALPAPDICLPADGFAEKIARKIDRWFRLRWLAFLTWIGLSVLSVQMLRSYGRAADSAIREVASWIASLGGTGIWLTLPEMWPLSYRLLALSWFVPIALRLPPGRGLLWLCSIQFFAVVPASRLSHEWTIAWLVGFILVNFCAIKGQRAPASIAVAATFALGFLNTLFASIDKDIPQVSLWISGNALYAATLLYLTKKIEPPGSMDPVPAQ